MPILRGIVSGSIVKKIIDQFTRTTSGLLGTATSGQIWSAIRGVWSANGSQATSSDTPSTYPIASISFGPNAILSADVSPGVGVAFWVSDANNWWAAYPFYTSSTGSPTCTGSVVTCSDTTNTCNPGGCGSVGSSSSTACTGPTVSCSDSTNTCSPGGCGAVSSSSSTSYSCPNGGYPYYFGGNCWDLPSHNGESIPATATTTYTRTQNTNVTTYTRTQNTLVAGATTYYSYLNIDKSVSGTVTNSSNFLLSSSGSTYPTVASIQVVTSNGTITAKGYSSTGLVTQLGTTLTSTPASPTQGYSVGLVKATSASQGTTADNFSATK